MGYEIEVLTVVVGDANVGQVNNTEIDKWRKVDTTTNKRGNKGIRTSSIYPGVWMGNELLALYNI